MNAFEDDFEFKRNVGEFILTFSEIEFTLGVLVSHMENGIEKNSIVPEIIGLDINEKRKRVRNGLKRNDTLFKLWEIIEGKISSCVEFRRFIAHGIVCNHMANPSLQGLIKVKPRNGIHGFKFKEITNQEVFENLKKLTDVNSGKVGLGVLSEEVTKWLKNEASV